MQLIIVEAKWDNEAHVHTLQLPARNGALSARRSASAATSVRARHRTTVVYADRFPHEEETLGGETGGDPAATSRRRP
jgi:hypothetical protein